MTVNTKGAFEDWRAKFAGLTDQQLKTKAWLGDVLIKMLAGDPDPRTPETVARLGIQRAEIQAEIEQRAAEAGPVDQIVGMQAIKLCARVGAQGHGCRHPMTRAELAELRAGVRLAEQAGGAVVRLDRLET